MRLAHLAGRVLQVLDARARPADVGPGHDEGLAVAGVEALREVAGELEVLALVLADRDRVGLVHEDVGRLQDRVGEQPDDAPAPRLPFSLNCVMRLASPKPVRQPRTQASSACSRQVALREDGAALAGRRPSRAARRPTGACARAGARVRDLGQRVQVGEEEEALGLVLHRRPVAHRPEVVAELEAAPVGRMPDSTRGRAGDGALRAGLGHVHHPVRRAADLGRRGRRRRPGRGRPRRCRRCARARAPGCCCSTAPTSRATSPAATGSRPQALDELARLGAADVLADRVPVRRLRIVVAGRRRGRRRSCTGPTTSCRARCSTPGWSTPRCARGAVLERRTVRRVEVRADERRARRRGARARGRRGRRRQRRGPTRRWAPAGSPTARWPSRSAATPRRRPASPSSASS